MTILRNFFFKILFKKIVFQFISTNQRYPSKKSTGDKALCFGLNFFLYLNQLIKKYQRSPDGRFQGCPGNLAC